MKTYPIGRLRERLKYNAETGDLIWTGIVENRRPANQIAGYVQKTFGYRVISLENSLFPAHRIAWALFYGEWPTKFVDHINGCTDDNRIANLREVSHGKNIRNGGLRRDNTTGFRGVRRHRSSGRYLVELHIGSFDTIEEARDAYVQASAAVFGADEFPNRGNPSLSMRPHVFAHREVLRVAGGEDGT